MTKYFVHESTGGAKEIFEDGSMKAYYVHCGTVMYPKMNHILNDWETTISVDHVEVTKEEFKTIKAKYYAD